MHEASHFFKQLNLSWYYAEMQNVSPLAEGEWRKVASIVEENILTIQDHLFTLDNFISFVYVCIFCRYCLLLWYWLKSHCLFYSDALAIAI